MYGTPRPFGFSNAIGCLGSRFLCKGRYTARIFTVVVRGLLLIKIHHDWGGPPTPRKLPPSAGRRASWDRLSYSAWTLSREAMRCRCTDEKFKVVHSGMAASATCHAAH